MSRCCATILAVCTLAWAVPSPCEAQAASRAASTQASQSASAASQEAPSGEDIARAIWRIPAKEAPLLAAGVVILLGWVVGVAVRPRKLALRQIPSRPSRLTTAHFGLVILAYLVPQLLVSCYYQYVQHAAKLPDHARRPIVIAVQLICIVVCLLVAKRTFAFGIGNGLGLNLRHPVRDIVWSVLAVLAVLPVVTALLMFSVWVVMSMGHNIAINPVLQDIGAREVSWQFRAMAAFSAVVLAPLSEELMFRGILQSMLRNLRIGPWTAIIGSSTLFCIMHIGVPQDVLPLAPLALLLGYSYERCGRLTVPILIHAMFNAVSVGSVLLA